MTETYRPILGVEDLSSRNFFQRPPIPEPGIALVFSGNAKPLLTLSQGQGALTWGEVRWGYNKLYRVDMTEHPLSFQCDLPCKGDAYTFHAYISFRCSVRDPETIVTRNITDVAQWTKGSIEDTLRTISRKYDITNGGDAEAEMRNVASKLIFEKGFNLSNLALKLSLQKEVIDWIRDQQRLEITSDLNRQRLEKEQLLANDLRQQSLEAQLKHQELEQLLAKQQATHEIEILRTKAEFYGTLLKGGNLQILALQLAQNPEDVRAIQQAMFQQQQAERDRSIHLLQTLLQADVIEGWQLTEVCKRALSELTGKPAILSSQPLDSLEPSNASKEGVDVSIIHNSKNPTQQQDPEFKQEDLDQIN